MMDLFTQDSTQPRIIDLPDADLRMWDNPDLGLSADRAYEALASEVPWAVRTIVIQGREIPQPRMTSWHGDPDRVYTYSGRRHDPEPWTPALALIKAAVERLLDRSFNSALCNMYRDGRDSIGAHSDSERELGRRPVIASLNLGGERTIRFRRKGKAGGPGADVVLGHGSLLVMAGDTQDHYLHRIDKVARAAPRINVTFRTIVGGGAR